MSNTLALLSGDNSFAQALQARRAGNTALAARINDVNNGVEQGGGIAVPKIRMRQNMLELAMSTKDITLLGQSTDLILLKVNPATSREYFATEYVKGQSSPPVCVSADGVKPVQIYSGTPGNIETGEVQTPTCKGCAKSGVGGKCSFFQNTVWVDKNDISPTGLRLITVGGASLLHNIKRPLLGNDPEMEMGFREYINKIAAFDLGDGQRMKSFEIMTTIKVYAQTESGFAMTFSPAMDQGMPVFTEAADLEKLLDLMDDPLVDIMIHNLYYPEDHKGAKGQVVAQIPQGTSDEAPAPAVAKREALTLTTEQIVDAIAASPKVPAAWQQWVSGNKAGIVADPAKGKSQIDATFPGLWDEIASVAPSEAPGIDAAAAAQALAREKAQAAVAAQAAAEAKVKADAAAAQVKADAEAQAKVEAELAAEAKLAAAAEAELAAEAAAMTPPPPAEMTPPPAAAMTPPPAAAMTPPPPVEEIAPVANADEMNDIEGALAALGI